MPTDADGTHATEHSHGLGLFDGVGIHVHNEVLRGWNRQGASCASRWFMSNPRLSANYEDNLPAPISARKTIIGISFRKNPLTSENAPMVKAPVTKTHSKRKAFRMAEDARGRRGVLGLYKSLTRPLYRMHDSVYCGQTQYHPTHNQ
jgi:hypothetical protein